jgi:hypothetical protein
VRRVLSALCGREGSADIDHGASASGAGISIMMGGGRHDRDPTGPREPARGLRFPREARKLTPSTGKGNPVILKALYAMGPTLRGSTTCGWNQCPMRVICAF